MLKVITYTLMAIAPDALGDGQAYELDTGLSGHECIASIEAIAALGLVEIYPNQWLDTRRGVTLTCEAVTTY